LIVNNTQYGIIGSSNNKFPTGWIIDCVIANNGTFQLGSGVSLNIANSYPLILINNILYGGQYCFYNGTSNVGPSEVSKIRYAFPNAFGGSSVSNFLNIASVPSDLTLTEDPFVDSANRDYRLNNKPGGGALCKNSGYVGNLPNLPNYRNYANLGYYKSKLNTVSL
jgi:hypothetical protein